MCRLCRPGPLSGAAWHRHAARFDRKAPVLDTGGVAAGMTVQYGQYAGGIPVDLGVGGGGAGHRWRQEKASAERERRCPVSGSKARRYGSTRRTRSMCLEALDVVKVATAEHIRQRCVRARRTPRRCGGSGGGPDRWSGPLVSLHYKIAAIHGHPAVTAMPPVADAAPRANVHATCFAKRRYRSGLSGSGNGICLAGCGSVVLGMSLAPHAGDLTR